MWCVCVTCVCVHASAWLNLFIGTLSIASLYGFYWEHVYIHIIIMHLLLLLYKLVIYLQVCIFIALIMYDSIVYPLQGMLMAYNISNYVCTLLNLHFIMGRPMTKTGVLAVCQISEMLKSIQCTFHRRSLVVAEFLTLAVNHYEILILTGLEKISVS